ncbi:MAG: MFS transporter [Planctomycetota bacterium]|nr:MFS transporter [Planctomycetota bacterium]
MSDAAISQSTATRVRYVIVAAATLMSFLLYLDRFCVSFAVDYIRQDLGMTQGQAKWFLSAFFWSYALAQVPAGWLSDRFGARIMLVIYILTWSFFTGLIGAAPTFVMLIGARLGLGLGQAGAYPTAASIVGRWMPIGARGSASATVATGGRIGGAVAPLLTAYLIVQLVPSDAPVRIATNDVLIPNQIAARLTSNEISESALEFSLTKRLNDDERSVLSPGGHLYRLNKLNEEIAILTDESIAHWYDAILEGLWLKRPPADVTAELDKKWQQAGMESGRLGVKESTVEELLNQRGTQQLFEIIKKSPNADPQVIVDFFDRLIDLPDLYDPATMKSLNLPKEALKTLGRMESGDSQIDDATKLRFNRFVLEGVFGKEIKKFYGQGWRPILYIYGAAGIFVAAFFWFFFHNRPEVHPWSNEAEHALILKGREDLAKHDGQKLEAAPVKELIKSFNMWCSCFSQWGTNVGWVFLVTWLSRYLMDAHNVPIIERGTMAMTPVLIGMLGMMSGGTVTDMLAMKVGIKWGRRIPIAGSRVVAMLAYLGCIGITTLLAPESPLNTPWVFVALFSVVAFSTDFGTPSSWAFTQDIGGRQVGSVLGWGNMWGNLGAAVSPLIYDYYLGENPGLREWNMMFAVCAAAFLFSGVCGLLMDATKPILPEEND